MIPVVTVLTPVYNKGSSINRLLDSLLNQTFLNFELILVNDGSIDNSESVIISYKDKFYKKGIDFNYIYKENGGPGSAINLGLKYVRGKYLCWPDADDYLESDSIEKRYKFLESNSDYGIVTSNAKYVDSKTGQVLHLESDNKVHCKEANQFEYILTDDSIVCAGTHMVRMEILDKVYPDRNIFEGRRGQNLQLIMPPCYYSKSYFLDEVLYTYMSYGESLSLGDDTYDKIVKRQDDKIYNLIGTMEVMKIESSELERYKKLIYIKDAKIRLSYARYFKNKTEAINNFKRLLNYNAVSLKDIIKLIFTYTN